MNEYDEDVLYPAQSSDTDDFSPEETKFLISMMVWSFSRLISYYHCPFEWKQKYLVGKSGTSSSFAQFGGYVHKIIELYFKDKLSLFELPIYYEDHYSEKVDMEFPRNNFVDLAEKYYEQGLDYFENFDMDLSKYEILGVEKEVKFEYEGYKFVGYIDLLLKDKEDGKLVILDHKSANIKFLKNGNISKKDKEHFEDFKKQLYLYSYAVMEEYGEGSVKALAWNLFRVGTVYEIPWKKKEYKAAMDWAVNTIRTIEQDTEWNVTNELVTAEMDGKYPPFYCTGLCSQRETCPYKQECIDIFKAANETGYADESGLMSAT